MKAEENPEGVQQQQPCFEHPCLQIRISGKSEPTVRADAHTSMGRIQHWLKLHHTFIY
jgi:hypothetical protein